MFNYANQTSNTVQPEMVSRGRGRQLANQVRNAAGSELAADPLALLKLIDDPTVTEAFNKKSAELHGRDQGRDTMTRTPAFGGSRGMFNPQSARSIDPALVAQVRTNRFAVPLRG
jgi:hypothetical protein